jgi:hypothetical protein
MEEHEENCEPVKAGREPNRMARFVGARLARWSDVAVGTMAEAERASRRALGVVRRDVAHSGRRLSDGAAGTRRTIAGLAERGAAERQRGRDLMAAGLDTALVSLATSPVLGRVVDVQLERVLRPVVDAVLDNVIDLLEREPDRIRSLVRSQRSTMVDELLTRIRSGAAAGDSNVDRLTSRVLHQDPAPAPPGEPRSRS